MSYKTPNMMTIREIAQTGLLSEYTLRYMLKEGNLPVMYVGKKPWSITTNSASNFPT